MSLVQRLMINLVLWFISVLNFFERKLFSFVKRVFYFGLNSALITVIYLNGSLFSYMVSGYLLSNYRDYLSVQAIEYQKGSVLGSSKVSLVRELPSPKISSNVVLVADKIANKILYETNGTQELAPASTTKLMTALVALDIYKLDDVLEMSSYCTAVEGSKIGLLPGKSYKVETIMNSLLIKSGADSACLLATGKLSEKEFVQKMNDKLETFGMKNTHFTNAIGLDGLNGSHYSTAEDLYILTKKAVENKTIASIVGTKDYTVTDVKNETKIQISNTNKLLWEIPNTVGVKTGTTAAAGEVLIYEYFEKDKNIDLVIIVLNSSDRFFDTTSLLNWTLGSYSWKD